MLKNLGLSVIFLFLIIEASMAQSQYFGQNKPRNKTNNFKVLQSSHFNLYYYDNNISSDFLKNAEYWYKLHQEVFKLAFIKPNPIILYNSHPDFQETTAIGGEIGEGTGGVTEGLRTRVVMPIMYTKRQTDHVLGHELVHAFQYQTMSHGGDSVSINNIQNIPLFMIEGLAEYMSLGRKDAHTAMWLRDAIQSNDIPSIKDLINKQNKYFPYRWGQAFWAYVTANYGDDIIRPLFKETAIYGIEYSFLKAFKMGTEAFSTKFKNDLVNAYTAQKAGKEFEIRGKLLASAKTGAEMNISPSISPDGKFLAYISSKNIFTLDIYIADAKTGKTIKKIESSSFGAHIDSYSFIETSGTWSPDSRKFAIVIQTKARNKLLVIDVLNGEKKEIQVDGLDSFTNPTWSPDGNSIIMSGLKHGVSDLYLYQIKNRELINLTKDEYSDIQPTYSPEGDYVYFVSDRGGKYLRLEKENFRISKLDLKTGKISTPQLFENGDNMNPALSPDGKYLYFLSTHDGFRNLYKYNNATQIITKLTNFYTGISGITMYSPAMALAAKTGEIVYNYFEKGDYNIILANDTHFLNDSTQTNISEFGSYLSPSKILFGTDIVQKNLDKTFLSSNIETLESEQTNYKPNFKLEYLANSGLGVSTSRFGTGMGGGVTALFGDMLSNNQLMGTVVMNGEIQDFGGQLFYLNQKRPLQFGVSASHIPYRFFGESTKANQYIDTTVYNPNGISEVFGTYFHNINRLLIDEFTFFAFKPISKSKRFEFSISSNWYTLNQREQPINGYFYVQNGIPVDFVPQQYLKSTKFTDASRVFNNFNYRQLQIAYVGDNTSFGTVAPLNGYRYRFEFSKTFGKTSFNQVLIDYRKYKYLKPVTLATRLFYNGRLNPKNIENLNQIYPLYLGFPWYIHGFCGNALNKQIGLITEDNLKGEQLAVANFEVRMPFTGPEKLALIPFEYLPSDLNFFIDGGMVWSKDKKIGTTSEYTSIGNTSLKFKTSPIFTTGLSLRINVLGYLIVEPYLAVPIYNGRKQPVLTGFNFMVAGW